VTTIKHLLLPAGRIPLRPQARDRPTQPSAPPQHQGKSHPRQVYLERLKLGGKHPE
jgi:hypothetical protein